MSVVNKKDNQSDLKPMKEVVHEIIRQAIFDGSYKRGDRLVETTLAKQLNVSRTPIREAFQQLESEGLIVSYPRKGAVVQGVSLEDAMEIYEIREVLDGLAARLACHKMSSLDLIQLRNIVLQSEEAYEANNLKRYMDFHKAFNLFILKKSQNQRLINQMTNIYEDLTSLRQVSLQEVYRRHEATKEHYEIVELLEKGDSSAVELRVRQHVKMAKEEFLKNAIRQVR